MISIRIFLTAIFLGRFAAAVDLMGNTVTYPTVTVDAITYIQRTSSVSCRSGFVETPSRTCDEVAPCTAKYALQEIDPLKTEFPTSLVPGRVVGTNSLEIVVQHPAVKDRVVKSIVLNATNAACNYPGANWYHGVDSSGSKCRDAYTSSIPWTLAASGCGLNRTENGTHVWFDGVGVVNYEDVLPALDGFQLPPRQVRSVVQFSLVQPKIITDITAKVMTFDDPRIVAAITRQQYDYQTRNATLQIIVSLATPLRTLSNQNATPPTGLGIMQTGTIYNDLCYDTLNTTCQQTYTFQIDPRTMCQLDGVYNFTFQVACHPSIIGTPRCPTDMTTMPMSIAVQLDGEDVCEVVLQLLKVQATLTSHGIFDLPTFRFGPEKTAFFQEQSIHFQCALDSTNGFPFDTSRILTVALEDKNGTRRSVYNVNDGGITPGWSFVLDTNSSSGVTLHRHHFVYQPAIEVFGDVERNMPVSSRVYVDVEIRFVNANRRRSAVVQLELGAMPSASSASTSLQLGDGSEALFGRLRQATPRDVIYASLNGLVTIEDIDAAATTTALTASKAPPTTTIPIAPTTRSVTIPTATETTRRTTTAAPTAAPTSPPIPDATELTTDSTEMAAFIPPNGLIYIGIGVGGCVCCVYYCIFIIIFAGGRRRKTRRERREEEMAERREKESMSDRKRQPHAQQQQHPPESEFKSFSDRPLDADDDEELV